MEIYFATKEENNKRREEEFLKLSPGERLLSFIDWVCTPSPHPLPDDYVHPNDKKGNFILWKKDTKDLLDIKELQRINKKQP